MLNLPDYVSFLLDLHPDIFNEQLRQRFFITSAFGLVEELLEYAEATQAWVLDESFKAEVIKEAGDVLAYSLLWLVSSEYKLGGELDLSFIQMFVSDVYSDNEGLQFTDVYTAAQTLAGDFKRLFREGKPVSSSVVIMALNTVLAELAPHGITLADVAETNIKKLQDRANRGVLLKGSGSNR